jgi:uncharacterized protein (TIGR03083 family)
MALSREVITDGLLAEMGRFEDMIRPLTPQEWDTPSNCAGWTVGDVARHAIGSMADAAAGRVDGLGSPEVTAREVQERAGKSASEMADECAEVTKGAAALLALFDDATWDAPAPGGYEGTLGRGIEALWYDFWLHGHDIATSLGRDAEPGPSLVSGMSHLEFELEKRGWSGPVPSSPVEQLAWVRVATGRAEPSGPDAPINVYAEA